MISQIVRRFKRLAKLPLKRAIKLAVLNLGYLVYAFADRIVDFWYGVETATSLRGLECLEGLTLVGNADHAIPYAPTPYGTLRKMFRGLRISPSECAFVDFGSGRGRTLVIASKYGFKEIIGVEFAWELHEKACRNIATSQARNARSVFCDAREFKIPDLPCVLFFFNPFTGDTLNKVAANVLRSFRRYPRRIIVALLNESSIAPFLDSGVFTLSGSIAESWLAQLSHSGRYVISILESELSPDL